MRKTSRHHKVSSELSGKRVLRLSQETVRTLTPDELLQAAGGSCPTGSWPTTTQTDSTGGI
ncbi:MAG TPA: hypothetical protein VF469_02140 [Kofleriaceae bacterium]